MTSLDDGQAAAAAALPPVGTVVKYEYHAAAPTPGPRTQLVLVTGHDRDRVLGVPLGHTEDQASFTVDQLAPV